ncbi:MAG: Cu(I)/Ag(I) efflux system membrane fusion protein, partial [Myxococcota bacterium]
PELLTAQRELLATAARKTKVASLPGSVLTEAAEHAHTAARERLRLWGMSNWQIAQVLKRKQAKERFVRYAAHSGTVTAVDVREGNWVKEGSAILTLTDLSRVWVEFQAYEQDLAWIALGQTVDFTTPSQPGRRLTGDVAFISPTIDPRTRTATIRIIVPDADAEKTLRPGSFVVGDARILLEDPEPLTIPLTAPLISGERAIVFVEMAGEDMPTYLPREVQLGRRTDHGWVVEAGLMAGERVVKAGAFKLDSDLQIRGEPSLMTPPKPSAESTKASGTTTSAPEEPILGKQGRTALSNVVRAAMVLSEAMAADDARAAEMAAPKLNDALMSLASEVDGQALSTALSDAATALTAAANSLDAIRSAYVALNQTLWPLVLRHKGLLRGAYQITFCPMANNDQGAYWLQGPGDVRNPYYGAEMLSCGAATHLVGGSTP